MDLRAYLTRAVDAVGEWKSRWGSYKTHASLEVDEGVLEQAFEEYTARLEGNYPFFHPRYAGQMLKPPHPVAVAGYVAAMLINPNNHALDGGPPTSEMEKEVIADLAAMFGFPDDALGHLTSSGTIANLEAIWIAREMHPHKGIAVSDQAHYTHLRVGELLRTKVTVIATDPSGRMKLDVLERELRSGKIGTVVVTTGTTGLGAVDPVADVLRLCDRFGARVHVDAAYGGFFALLARDHQSPLDDEARRHFHAIEHCDSVVVDPHKHGLQPYGCGCILFRDPRVGRVYKHDSPYTYFTSDALHLGEISLECSRPGAAAGALWLTLRMLPLKSREGLGPVLAAGLRAARDLHRKMATSHTFVPLMEPALDILTYFPAPESLTASAIDRASQAVFERSMTAGEENAIFVSVMRTKAARVAAVYPQLNVDTETVRVLRSVLMKPEHEEHVAYLYDVLRHAADDAAVGAQGKIEQGSTEMSANGGRGGERT